LISAGSAGLAGCGGGNSGTPIVNVAGVYTGSFSDPSVASNPLQLTITQQGTVLRGSWTGGLVNPPSEPEYGSNGEIPEGNVSGTSVTMELAPEVYNLAGYALKGTISGKTISGTFTVINAAGGGTFTATKT
jgi:hypothetical protein